MSSATSQVFMSFGSSPMATTKLAAAEGAVGIFARLISAASGSLRFTKSNGPWTHSGPGRVRKRRGSPAARAARPTRRRRFGSSFSAAATLICTVVCRASLGFIGAFSGSEAERCSSATSMTATPAACERSSAMRSRRAWAAGDMPRTMGARRPRVAR